MMSFNKKSEEPMRVAEKPSLAPKRRALGDITNAFTDEESKESGVAKRPQFAPAGPALADNEGEIENANIPLYMQRPVDDIDGRDSDNPLLVTEYVNEMYEHFGAQEREFAVSSSYMGKQDLINEKMRAILIDWLVR